MPDIAAAFKSEIARIARKEIRREVDALRKANAQHRSLIAALRRKVDALGKALRRASRGTGKLREAPEEAETAGTRRRFSAARLAAHRQKIGFSAADYGRLVGVSGQTIYAWEAGKTRPRASQLEALATVRGISKREALARLEK